jgi:membrane associated rhomboid family serine protease/cytochrome c-type biogenesis protein CcmH/NrfG
VPVSQHSTTPAEPSVRSTAANAEGAAEVRSDAPTPESATNAAWNKSRELSLRFPWLTLLLASLIVATYCLQVFTDHHTPKDPMDPVLLAISMKGAAVLTGQWWRLLTSIFVHVDLYHLVSNLCFLLLFGAIAETVFQRGGYLLLWFLAGLAGSMSQLVALSPNSYGYGASGVAFGLVGALWGAYCLQRVPSPTIVRRWAVVFLLAFFILLGFLPDWIHSRSFNAAHFGGLLAGMILGLMIPMRATPAPMRRIGAIFALAAIAFLGCAKIALAKHEPFLQLAAIERAHPDLLQSSTPTPAEIATLQNVVARRPELTTAHLLLARAYNKDQRYAEAGREYSLVLATHPHEAAIWNEAGNAFMGAHLYSEATVAFSHFLELTLSDPSAAGKNGYDASLLQALRSLAQAYELGGQLEQAIHVNQHLLDANPQDAIARDNLNRLLQLRASARTLSDAPNVPGHSQ